MPSHSHFREAPLTPDENLPPLTAQKSPADLCKFEIGKNVARSEATSLRRKFIDVTNADEDEQDNKVEQTRLSKRARTELIADLDDTNNSEEEKVSNTTDERFVHHAGHKFGLTCALWVHKGQRIFDTKVDKDYEAAERFKNDKNKVQGQLQEILGLLRVRLSQDTICQKWVRRQFMKSVNQQRSNTASRLRNHCAPILGVSQTDLLKSEDRKAFRDQIGWVVNEDGRGSYSAFDVKILHKDYDGQFSLSSAFLNPVLMSLYVALIHGPVAGMYFLKDGAVFHPQAQTMSVIHNIRHTTPGAIATTAILARWVLSTDDMLQEVGASTGIQYFKNYEEYLMLLESGLRRKKKSVLNIFRKWDEAIFPGTDSSPAGPTMNADDGGLRRMMAQLYEDSEEEDGEDNGAQE